MAEPDFILTGERAALGVLRREHLPTFNRWFNDPQVRHSVAHRGIVDEDAQVSWYEDVSEKARAPRPEVAQFAVHDVADGALVGSCGLDNIDHHFGRAEFGIFIGQRRGTGLGADATRLTLDWAFNMLGLHNVMLEAFDFNERAQHAYEQAGFRMIGRRRGAVRTLGRRWDAILMDATADDFDSPVLAALRS